MSGSYRKCVECGKRALKFATRCPGCGIELPSPASFEEIGGVELNGYFSMKIVMGVVAVGGVLVSLERGPAAPAPLSAETAVNTSSAVRRPVPAEQPAMVAALPAKSPAVPATAAATVAAPAEASARVELVAKAWTNVHRRRSANTSLEAVLTPGDTVTADSLAGGWYRVALYGDVLGWARKTTLAPTRP